MGIFQGLAPEKKPGIGYVWVAPKYWRECVLVMGRHAHFGVIGYFGMGMGLTIPRNSVTWLVNGGKCLARKTRLVQRDLFSAKLG